MSEGRESFIQRAKDSGKILFDPETKEVMFHPNAGDRFTSRQLMWIGAELETMTRNAFMEGRK